MEKKDKLVKFLSTGSGVTARQITSSFGLKNPQEAIRKLRNEGYCVYANKTKLADGTQTVKYRIGTPSKRMIAIASRVAGAQIFQG